MPNNLSDIFESLAKRIRKLECMEPGPSIYMQISDPGAVGAGSIWIDTTTNTWYYRDDTDTSWVAINAAVATTHDIEGASHSAAGLTIGDILTATAANAFAFQTPIVPALIDHAHAGIAGDGDTFDAANLTSGGSGDNTVLTSDGIGGAAWEALPAVGAHTILSATHTDTNVAAPSDDDVLTWDSFAGEWLAAPIPAVPAQTTIADDPIWTNMGDLAVGVAANMATILSLGAVVEGAVLTRDNTQPAQLGWIVPPSLAADPAWLAYGDIPYGDSAGIGLILPLGNDGDILSVIDPGTGPELVWSPRLSRWVALGDLAVGTGMDSATILTVGANGEVLSVNNLTASGLEWVGAPPPGAHDIDGASHTLAGATPGNVLTATGAGAFSFQPLPAGGSVATDNIWDAAGDLVKGTGANTANRLPIGSAGDVLTVVAGIPAWQAPSAGGGNVATDAIWDAAGDLVVGTGPNTASKLAAGSVGEVLTIVGGIPSWEPAASAGVDQQLAIMNLLGWA